MSAQLPTNPYDNQIWVDGNQIRWQWSSELDVWIRIGAANTLPLADTNTIGLMSPQDKRLLDSIPIVAGAFGIITNQATIIQSSDNRSGLISGNIKLHSDSLDIKCVDAHGEPYLGQVLQDTIGVDMPGLEFSLSDKFLNSLCLEIAGPAGSKGDKGLDGEPGKDGFTNGPAGEKGDPGIGATVAHTFSGIKVIESDEITDEAVVTLEMDGKTGRLSYTTAKMNVPSNTDPADQLLAIPIQRSLTYPFIAENGRDYVTLDDWQLQIPPGDALPGDPEVLLVKMPNDIEVGDTTPIELTKLTDFISVVVQSYKDKLSSFQDVWMTQMKEYIEGKDAAAREALSVVAQQLAQCEFKRPLQLCLGISPGDCSSTVEGSSTPNVPTSSPQPPPIGILSSSVAQNANVANVNPSASFDPTDPTKCLLPYKMLLVIITDEANPIYVTGIDDEELGVVNLYYNDRLGWEQFIDNLDSNQAVALGLLQIPRTESEYYGDQRDIMGAESTLPYDSLNSTTFYKLLPIQNPKITSSDIVDFVNRMLSIQYCGNDFVPDQINILFKSKALSSDVERVALNDAIAELKRTHSTCFVSTVSSASNDHNQDDRWLLDAVTTAKRFMCYHNPETFIPGQDHVVILCIIDEASPIYSYVGYNGPDGTSGPVGIPQNMTAWDFDLAKWNDSLGSLQGSANKIRLGILQPQGFAGASPLGGLLKPDSKAWPGDIDRNIITVIQTNEAMFTADDILAAFQSINNNYSATILYIVIDTSGSLGDPNVVSNTVDAGIAAIKLKYPDIAVQIDVVDIGNNKQGELAIPPTLEGYVAQPAPDAYLWGWEYVSTDGRNSILFPSLYVRSTIDAAERWLGRAVGIVEQLINYWNS